MRTVKIKAALMSGYLCMALLVFGQGKSEDIQGKWKFEEIYESEKLDSAGLAMMDMLFGEMTFQFNEDGLYKAYIMGNEEQGEWNLDGGREVLLSSEKGVVTPLEIIELRSEKFVFSLQGRPFVMAKIPEAEMEILTAAELRYEPVSATKDQVVGKWFLKRKESMKESSEWVEKALSEVFKESYLEFLADGQSESSIAGLSEASTWQFGENNASIVVSGDEGKRVWNIVGISKNELILILGTTDEKWIFDSSE